VIARAHRFHGRGSLQRHYKRSQAVRAGAVTLWYIPRTERSGYRLAVVVSRKVSKSAVVRNRIRRRTYEHVRILSSSFANPCDLVIVVYDEKLATLASVRLEGDLRKMLEKAGVFGQPQPQHAIVETKE
jgi:ribonuclease P protein component